MAMDHRNQFIINILGRISNNLRATMFRMP
jgi:hypothetical protein